MNLKFTIPAETEHIFAEAVLETLDMLGYDWDYDEHSPPVHGMVQFTVVGVEQGDVV